MRKSIIIIRSLFISIALFMSSFLPVQATSLVKDQFTLIYSNKEVEIFSSNQNSGSLKTFKIIEAGVEVLVRFNMKENLHQVDDGP